MIRTHRRYVVSVTAVLACGALAIGISNARAVAPEVSTISKISLDEFEGLVTAAREHTVRLDQEIDARAASVVPPDECRTVNEGVVTALRYAGANRYETAVCVSYWTWWDHNDPEAPPEFVADAVVLSRGDLFPDALAGGPLAAQAEAPLLLTTPTAFLPEVKTEIQRVLAPGGTVYLLGGTGALSDGIKSELEAAGYATIRLAGASRFETAIEIAKALPPTSNFFFVTGMNFPDALSAGTAAAALTLGARLDEDPATRPFALLLTNDDTMPATTRDFAIARGEQLEEWALLTAGGAADTAAAGAFGAGNLVARYVGINRYETATLVAEDIFTDEGGLLAGYGTGLATGENFPDALAATSTLALFAEPLLLTSSTGLSTATRVFLEAHAGDIEAAFLDVFGGTGVISDTVKNAAVAAFTPPTA